MKRIGVIGLALCAGLLTGADSAQKRDTVLNMKRELAKTTPWLDLSDKRSGAELLAQLDGNGSFRDLAKLESEYWKNNWGDPKFDTMQIQTPVLNMLTSAFDRLLRIALDLRDGKFAEEERAAGKGKTLPGRAELREDRIRPGK